MPNLHCPHCSGPMAKLPRAPGGFSFPNDLASGCLFEIAMWLVIVSIVAFSEVHWAVGAASAVVWAALFYYWRRSLTKYKCGACGFVAPFYKLQTPNQPGTP